MLSQRSGSYTARQTLEKQEQRMRGSGREALPSPDRLLTDRTSYITYLEAQLERVSAACLTVQSFDSRIEEAVSAIRCLEEKTLNLARLISTTQQFAEQQDAAQREVTGEVTRRLRAVETRLGELEQPGRDADWEAKLRAVSAQVDTQLQQVEGTTEQRLRDAAAELKAGLEEACHATHLQLNRELGDATGRLAEVERRVRAVDEYAHRADQCAAVADLAGRLGSVEDSVAHLAQSDGGMKCTLGSLQAAVGQLKTAVVALELRPPLGDAVASSADCLQWLARARGALKREVTDIRRQHDALAAGLHSAAAAAAGASQSPQKVLAAQVLSGLQSGMQQEVGKELQALQQADEMLATMASTLTKPLLSLPGQETGSEQLVPAGPAASKALSSVCADTSSGGWTVAAVPAAGAAETAVLPPTGSQESYPTAPSSQQAVSSAADGALAQLQQLAGGKRQLAQATIAAASGGGDGGGSLCSTFDKMQQMLQSVCQLLQQEGPVQQQQQQRQQAVEPSQAGYQAAAARYLSHSSTLPRDSGSAAVGAMVPGLPRQVWVPGGSSKPIAAALSRSQSYRPASAGAALVGGRGGGAKEALRGSVLGQKALAERRKRLQDLYAELMQQS